MVIEKNESFENIQTNSSFAFGDNANATHEGSSTGTPNGNSTTSSGGRSTGDQSASSTTTPSEDNGLPHSRLRALLQQMKEKLKKKKEDDEAEKQEKLIKRFKELLDERDKQKSSAHPCTSQQKSTEMPTTSPHSADNGTISPPTPSGTRADVAPISPPTVVVSRVSLRDVQRGIHNIGNTCYIGSMISLLTMIPFLRDHLPREQDVGRILVSIQKNLLKPKSNDTNEDGITQTLQKNIRKLRDQVVKSLDASNQQLTQHDPSEFLCYLIDIMRNSSSKQSDSVLPFIKQLESLEISSFTGSQESCKHLEPDCQPPDPFCILKLPLPKGCEQTSLCSLRGISEIGASGRGSVPSLSHQRISHEKDGNWVSFESPCHPIVANSEGRWSIREERDSCQV